MAFRMRTLRSTVRPTVGFAPVAPRAPFAPRFTSSASATAVPSGKTLAYRLTTRVIAFGAYTAFAFSAGMTFSMLSTMPASLFGLTFLSDKESLENLSTDEAAVEVEKRMAQLDIVKKLRADPTLTECRPHSQLPEKVRKTNLTATTLVGPTMIPVQPLSFRSADRQTLTTIVFLGHDLCGHPDIVHGGLLATMLDEQSGFCCIPLMMRKMAVTAYLNVNYRRPAYSDKFYVIKTNLKNLEGRKAFVKSVIEDLDGKVIADADSLFIEPKWAKFMPRFM